MPRVDPLYMLGLLAMLLSGPGLAQVSPEYSIPKTSYRIAYS